MDGFGTKIQPGGHKISCEACKTVLKTDPKDTKVLAEYTARAWGWKKLRAGGWRCPKHLKDSK
jgi:hypothetical protein